MIGDPTEYLNRRAEDFAERIQSAGYDPAFEEADEEEHDDFGYFMPKELGIEATIARDGLISVIYVHFPGHHGYKGYGGQIPHDLEFSMSRDQVRCRRGTPEAEGGPVTSPLESSEVYWDRWLMGKYELHCEYPATCDSIQMITITRNKRAEQTGVE